MKTIDKLTFCDIITKQQRFGPLAQLVRATGS